MRIQAYTAYNGTIIFCASTPRDEAAPSTRFIHATVHEDWAGLVRATVKEHKHIAPTSPEYPAAKRIQTYLPTHDGKPLYALRELKPAGSPRGIDGEYEVMQMRYEFMLNLLPAAFAADEVTAEGIERHMEYAFSALLEANGVPNVFIPGDQGLRPGDRTDIDIRCELGAASGRMGVDIAPPAQN